jgi:hypothetical protein
VIVRGLDTYNIVIVGTDFSIQRVQLDDFDFGGIEPEIEFRMPQIFQVSAGEYFMQVLPGRLQVGVKSSPATPGRIRVLTQICQAFLDGYATKRSLIAVGYNFSGDVDTSFENATDFMKHIAWRDDFAVAMGTGEDLFLSLTSKIRTGDEQSRTVRLEPLATDNTRLFYDVNFNWGEADKPLQTPVSDVLAAFADSLKLGTELIDRIVAIGSSPDRSQ